MNSTHQLELPGLDGANPLGFLAALGVLASLDSQDYRLAWRPRARVTAVLDSRTALDPQALCETLATALTGRAVAKEAKAAASSAQEKFRLAKRALEDEEKTLKKNGVRAAERAALLGRLAASLESARGEYLQRLTQSAPWPEMVLGDRLDCTNEEYREAVATMTESACRRALDMLAAFGSDAGPADEKLIVTRFCFITGSGHQFFLETARQLAALASPTKVREALFEPWAYLDRKYAMRWDPVEDRRYAYLAGDPSKDDNKIGTVWMANCLAYHGLALFPCVPTRYGAETTAWKGAEAGPCFTWPIWTQPASADSIRALLQLAELRTERPGPELRERGVELVFRSRRLKVGSSKNYKLNFSPPYALF